MKLKKLFCYLFIIVTMLCFTACSASKDSAPGASYDSSDSFGESGEENGEVGSEVQIQSGQLTASAYDDNEHYDFWKSLIGSNQEKDGMFKKIHNMYAFKTNYRIEINVPKNLTFRISLLNENDEKIYSSINDVNGKCYLYPTEYKESYKVQFEYYNQAQDESVSFTKLVSQTYNLEIDEINQIQPEEYIQLMFVIDATGSMGDEIEYLKAEIIDIIEKVKEDLNGTKIELAMLIYRDHGDNFVTKYSDFTEDIAQQINFLKPIYANGGGDFEEAVDVAMKEAANKDWSESAKTKILIHVADAPSHDKNIEQWYNATLDLSSHGVRVITVASSGIDKKTEFLFRSQSMLTLGKYVYLTDDSGIGNSHLEPTIEEKQTVEYLNMCLVRLIKGYYTGVFEIPIEYSQVQNNVE